MGSRMRTLAIAGLLGIGGMVVGCSHDQPQTPPPLATVLQGWFTASSGASCKTFCAGNPWPECQAADCVTLAVDGYGADFKYYGGTVVYSRQAATTSSFAPLFAGEYRLEGNQLERPPVYVPLTISVWDADGFTGGHTQWHRVDKPLEATLNAVVARDELSWRGLSVSQ